MKLLVTGANGFVGKNLLIHLNEIDDVEVVAYTRKNQTQDLHLLLDGVDAVIHLAGINRPKTNDEFKVGNTELTQVLAESIKQQNRTIPVIYSSSIQAERGTPYGESKKAAEDILIELHKETNTPVYIYRLANVFGKWCKPNYNSMVATFCHNIIRDIPIEIHNEDTEVQLVYVDDVVSDFIKKVTDAVKVVREKKEVAEPEYAVAEPVYTQTVRNIANQLKAFKESRETLITEQVGSGLIRKLYSTYVSYLPTNAFSYKVPKHGDERGVFVEMLKTPDAGQFSFFTAHPGVTRGGHYHHSKTEKFLVIKGEACFHFRHMVTGEFYELFTDGDTPEIVETAPGWSHDITNVGDDEMVVMLWANEVFDRNNPDTYACPVGTE